MMGVPLWLGLVFGFINLFHALCYPIRFWIRAHVTVCRYAYFAARIVMLIVMFLCLRALQPGAYQTVRWLTFLPHI
jgi:hypothetical protein